MLDHPMRPSQSEAGEDKSWDFHTLSLVIASAILLMIVIAFIGDVLFLLHEG